jgi:hypothetical protein
MKWQLQSASSPEDETSPMQTKWPHNIQYPTVPKGDYEYDAVMPSFTENEMPDRYIFSLRCD